MKSLVDKVFVVEDDGMWSHWLIVDAGPSHVVVCEQSFRKRFFVWSYETLMEKALDGVWTSMEHFEREHCRPSTPCPLCGDLKGFRLQNDHFHCFACAEGGDLERLLSIITNNRSPA